ncbi:hypothetical protein D3C75_1214130 [compost metagenome]
MKSIYRTNDVQPNDYGLGLKTNIENGLSPLLPKDAFALTGNGLNVVLIIPSLDLIVLRTSQVNTIDNKQFYSEFFEKAKAILK